MLSDNKKYWTLVEEEKLLAWRRESPRLSFADCANRLGRSESSVQSKARELGLQRKHRRTQAEVLADARARGTVPQSQLTPAAREDRLRPRPYDPEYFKL